MELDEKQIKTKLNFYKKYLRYINKSYKKIKVTINLYKKVKKQNEYLQIKNTIS